MTLIVTVNGPDSIWLLADRRLSYKGRKPKDDARKVMFLQATDGVAILGYAGLGATARGTEPSDWMSAVLRGTNLPLEQSLGVLAAAATRQFGPLHMVRIPTHSIIVPAFRGKEARLYTIDLAFAPNGKIDRFRYTCHWVDKPILARRKPPRLGLGGSGGSYLALQQDKKWMRELLRKVNAYDRGRVSPYAVADELAKLNTQVSRMMRDKKRDESVGPCCIVAWRPSEGSAHKTGGGHQFYTGTRRDRMSPGLPTIARGIDVQALVAIEMPDVIKMFEAMRVGRPAKEPNKDEINARLAQLPDKPDENLR